MRDLFLESEAAEPVQPNRAPALRAGVSRPIHVSGYDRKVGDFYATLDWVTEALLCHVRLNPSSRTSPKWPSRICQTSMPKHVSLVGA